MNWVKVNERLIELENLNMSAKEMEEWNKLLSLNIAGTLKRNKISEEDITKTKREEQRKEEVE